MSQYTLLVFIISFVAIATVLCIAVTSLTFFSETIKRNIKEIRVLQFSNTTSQIIEEMNKITIISKDAAASVSVLNVSVEDRPKITKLAWEFYKKHEQYSKLNAGVMMGMKDGGVNGFIKDSKSDMLLQLYSVAGVPDRLCFHEVSSPHDSAAPNVIIRGTDCNTYPGYAGNQPFYLLAKANNVSLTGTWSQPYPDYSNPNSLFVVYSVVLRDPDTNDFMGCWTNGVNLRHVGLYLNTTSSINDNVITVMDVPTGQVIASTDTAFERDSTDNKTLNYRMVKYSKSLYGEKFESIRTIPNKILLEEFRFGSKRYLLNIMAMNDGMNVEWIILQAIPLRVFYTQFSISIIIIVIITIVLLIASTVISLVSARLFMAPIHTLIVQAADIENLNLEGVEIALEKNMSLFSEIRGLQSAFYSMNQRLKQFKSFIPDHILAMLEQQNTKSNEMSAMGAASTSFNVDDVSSSKTRTSISSDPSGRSFVGNRKDSLTQAFSLGLNQGVVTLMSIQMNISPFLDSHPHLQNELTQMNKEVVSIIHNSVRVSRGQIVSVNQGNFLIAWNALTPCPDHMVKAFHTSLILVSKITRFRSNWEEKLKRKNTDGNNVASPPDIQIGLASGDCWIGNIGNDHMKYYSVIGKPVQLSEHMCNIAKEWRVQIVCAGSILLSNARNNKYMTRMFDVQPETSSRENELVVFELGDSLDSVRAEEWMYEMADNDFIRRWEKYSEAYELYKSAMFDASEKQFKAYLEKYPNDYPTTKMIERVDKILGTTPKDAETSKLP